MSEPKEDEFPLKALAATKMVRRGLGDLVEAALQIEAGLRALVDDLEERAQASRKARPGTDSPPDEEH